MSDRYSNPSLLGIQARPNTGQIRILPWATPWSAVLNQRRTAPVLVTPARFLLLVASRRILSRAARYYCGGSTPSSDLDEENIYLYFDGCDLGLKADYRLWRGAIVDFLSCKYFLYPILPCSVTQDRLIHIQTLLFGL